MTPVDGSTRSAEVFVGRRRQLQVIASALGDAAAGRPRLVLVEGEAGVGKSALLREALAAVPGETVVRRAQADELARQLPLWVAGQWAPLTAVEPFAAGLELLSAVTDSDGGVALLVLEDLHWADDPSRQALLTLARRLDHEHVLIVVTSRPDAVLRSPGWARLLDDPERCVVVPVGPLAPADVAELSRRLGRSLSPSEVDRLQRHTQGHALHLRTVLAEVPADALRGPGDLPVPRSLGSSTTTHLSTLSTDAQELVGALAVLDGRNALSIVAATATIADPAEALESLLATGFVAWDPSDPLTPVWFTHPLYRSAVYDDLSPARRQRLHRAASVRVDERAAMRHRVVAASSDDDELAADLEAAALAGSATAGDVATYLLWASQLSSDRADRERRLVTAVRSFIAADEVNAALAQRDAVEGCRRSPQRDIVLGMLLWRCGEPASSERFLLAAAMSSDDDVALEALSTLAEHYAAQSRSEEALAVVEQALTLVDDDAPARARLAALRAVSTGLLHGTAAGLDALRDDLPVDPDRVGDADSQLLVARGMMNLYAGHASAAIADLSAVLTLVRGGTAVGDLARVHVYLSNAQAVVGDWDHAEVNARLAVELVSDDGHQWLLAQAHSNAAHLAAGRGRWSDAEHHVDAAHEAAAGVTTYEGRFWAHLGAAAVARARGDHDAAVAALLPLVGDDGAAVPMASTLGWWSTLVEALIERRDLDHAAAQLDLLAAAATRRRLRLDARVDGLRGQLVAARQELPRALEAYESAVAGLDEDDAVIDRAIIHHRYGRLLRAAGRRGDAASQYAVALELLTRVDAVPYVARLQLDLEETGASTRRPRQRWSLGLTDRERDVATLVASGHTNREVAAELYVSPKAVEYHLRNIFGKLGIDSRRQLRDRLADIG